MPTVLAASITRVCGGTWTARPSMVRLIRSGMGPPGGGRVAAGRMPPRMGAWQPERLRYRRSSYGHHASTVLVGARFTVQVIFEFLPELLHDGDGRHGGGIAQRAERAAQHVFSDIADQVDIGACALAVMEAHENFLQPGGALPAGDAPAAAFMGVEAHDAQHGLHHAGVFVHDDDAAHFLDHLLHREAEFEFVDAGLIDVPGEAGHLGAAGFGNTERRERRAAIAQDGRDRAEGLHVIQDGRALERARDGGKRRADARDAALAFERFQQRRFLTALVGARAGVRVEIEIETRALDVLAEPALFVGLGEGLLHHFDEVAILAADIDVAGVRIHRQAGNQHALDQLVGIVFDQHAILAGAGLTLVAVDHDVLGLGRGARHEAPLHAGRETRAAAPAEIGNLHLGDDLFGFHLRGLEEGLVAFGGQVGIDGRRIRQAEAPRQHLGLKRTRFVEKHRLWLLPEAIQKLIQFFGRDVVVEIVVYLDGGGPGTGAYALHFLNRELAVGGDFLVADAELPAGVFVELVAIVQQATDVGADLHVVFPQRLGVQHGVIRQDFIDLQRSDPDAGSHFIHQFVGDLADFILRVEQHGDHRRALASRRIALQEFVKPGFQLRGKCHYLSVSPVRVAENEIHAADGRDHIRDQGALHHSRHGLEIAETGRAHVYAVRVGGSVAHHVVSEFAARRFNHLVDLAFGYAEALGNDLEMVNQGLHLGLHFFAVGQHDVRRVRLPGARGHTVHGLADDAHALPHFFEAHQVTRVDIVLGARGNFEIELLVAGVGCVLAGVYLQSGGAQHGPGDRQVQHVLQRNHADAHGAAHPDTVGGQQVLILIDAAGEDVDECFDALVPPARWFQGQPADAEVAGHHALAAELFEDLEDLLALAEAVEEHRHGADIESVRAQPHQMAVEPREFGEHHAHPLGRRRDLQLQQFLHRQAVAQVHGERRQVIHAVGQGDRLLIVLNFELLFDAGVQKTDVRPAGNDCFAV